MAFTSKRKRLFSYLLKRRVEYVNIKIFLNNNNNNNIYNDDDDITLAYTTFLIVKIYSVNSSSSVVKIKIKYIKCCHLKNVKIQLTL